jgi:hypothetical protein
MNRNRAATEQEQEQEQVKIDKEYYFFNSNYKRLLVFVLVLSRLFLRRTVLYKFTFII